MAWTWKTQRAVCRLAVTTDCVFCLCCGSRGVRQVGEGWGGRKACIIDLENNL